MIKFYISALTLLDIWLASMYSSFNGYSAPNTACSRPLHKHQGYSGGSLRVFEQFSWLGVGSGKVAFPRPTHQRVTPAVGWLLSNQV